MSLTVKYLDTPEGARDAAAVTCERLQPFSNTASIASGAQDVAWATLEPGQWVLDGTRDILPDNPENIGWWSGAASDAGSFILGESVLGETPLGNDGKSCLFDDPPVIIIDFSQRFTATGITISFSPSTEQWCTQIRVRWYRGEELLAELEAHPDSPNWSGGDAVESFNRITIELFSTNEPAHLAKLQQIIVGQTIIFDRSGIIKAQLFNEVDHTLGVLSADTSRFELRSPDLTLNPQENQRAELYRDSTLLAAHYIESSARESGDHYTLSCQSAVGLLADDYLGGIYQGVPVDDVVSEILDGRRYEIDAALADETITGYLPVCTQREALQQVAFAIGAVVTTQGTDKIRLVPLPTDTEGDEFTGANTFLGAKLEAAPRVAKCQLTVHKYTASNTVETLLEDEEISGEDVLVTFDKPHHDYEITGGTITGSGANWIAVTADGAVTVTAKAYNHTTTVRSKKNPDATYTERSNVVSVTDATLVNKSNGTAVLNRLYSAELWRQTLTQDVIITDQRAGMIVQSGNPWGGKTKGMIVSMDSELTQNGHTAQITIIGGEVSE